MNGETNLQARLHTENQEQKNLTTRKRDDQRHNGAVQEICVSTREILQAYIYT